MPLLSQRAAAIKPSSHYQKLSIPEQGAFAYAVADLPVDADVAALSKRWRDLILAGEAELRKAGKLRAFTGG